MKHLLLLASKSAWNRRFTLSLTVLAIALSVTMLLGVERLRKQTHHSFSHSISGTDLVVGARTSPVQLMLYAVFRMGEATNNMSWPSYQAISNNPMIAWSIPISLGDSHHGFPVLGTTREYFEHFHYGDSQRLNFSQGQPFDAIFDVVLGAEVAAQYDYQLGDAITLSHGMSNAGPKHDNKLFTVVGILAPTGTPVDRTLHVSLEAINAIHLDWIGGAPMPGFSIPAKFVKKFDLAPKEITAALIGLKNRATVFKLQREINTYDQEALLGVLPGVALEKLWQVVNIAEKSLKAVSAMVVVVGLSGLIAVVLAGLNERRRELAILRSVGAKPRDLFLLLSSEGLLITLSGIVIGVALLSILTLFLAPIMQSRYGILLNAGAISFTELKLLSIVLAVSLLACVIPGYRAYQLSLVDGLTPRI
ncbi:MAG: ABC transporter permease [Methylotenera sp.]